MGFSESIRGLDLKFGYVVTMAIASNTCKFQVGSVKFEFFTIFFSPYMLKKFEVGKCFLGFLFVVVVALHANPSISYSARKYVSRAFQRYHL